MYYTKYSSKINASLFFQTILYKKIKQLKAMKKVFLLCSLFVLGISATINAQSVDDVLAKYYKAIGGVEKWKELKSMRQEGQGEQMGFQFPVKLISARPNLSKLSIEVQGMEIIEAFDGEVAWGQMPFDPSKAKPTAKSKEETEEAAKEQFEDELIDWANKGHKIALQGSEEIDGVKAIKLHLIRKDGDEKFYFLDPETHLPLVVRAFAKAGPMKGKAIDTYMSDYKDVKGLMMAHSIEQKVDGQTAFAIKMDKIELNVSLSKEDFSIPK